MNEGFLIGLLTAVALNVALALAYNPPVVPTLVWSIATGAGFTWIGVDLWRDLWENR